jgi:hypothetical protein
MIGTGDPTMSVIARCRCSESSARLRAGASSRVLHLLAAAGMDAQHDCRTLPIFLSGRNVPTVTDHDIEALTGYVWNGDSDSYVPSTAPGYTLPPSRPDDYFTPGTGSYISLNQPHFNPQWVLLHWEGSTDKYSGWYTNHPDCAPAGDACDEFPLLATEEGGRPAQPTPHMRKVNANENSSQGPKFQGGKVKCGLERGTPPEDRKVANSTGGSPLIFLPMPEGPVGVQSQWLCKAAT